MPAEVALRRLDTMQHNQPLVDNLVREEISRIISLASRGRGFLRAGEHAYNLAKAYPNSGLTGEELVDAIIAAAASAGVAVEMNRPVAPA
jgi:hypothetical protein